jgi:hypothetical protein
MVTIRKSTQILLFIILFLPEFVSGQTLKNFSHDKVKFIAEMEAFLQATNKKDGEKLMERFLIPWNAGKFSPAQQEIIYNTSDGMLKKRLKAFPDFSNYLNALIGFSQSSQSTQSFDNWHAGIDKLLKGSVRNFSNYLEVCYDLFATNTLFSSSSTVWKSNNNGYSFEFDSLPKIVFTNFNLACTAKSDSAVIYNTKGAYYPNLKRFYGVGGTVNWLRAGLPAGDVYADLKKFTIDLTGSDFDADSVTFYNRQIFSQPLIGRLSEKILANATVESATYPRFRSYNMNLEIKELVKDASYKGGFSMHGSKMIGSGGRDRAASLIFSRSNKPFLALKAQSFVIRPERIVSDNATVTFYLGSDSIYHPGLEFKYISKERELSLIRPSGKSSGTPYYNSFHGVDMYFDAMVWKIDDPLIDMKMISGEGEVKLVFESANFFRAQRYQRLQGLSEVNPLYTIKAYGEKYQTKVIGVSEFASHLRMEEGQIRNLFLALNSQGFLAYDETTDKAVIKDRLYYYLSASVGKTDYDIIEFSSQISGKPNATLNLLNYDINMRGVSRVALSDTQNVFVVPTEQEITLQKNRNFTFDGRVHAGRFDFVGKEFAFNYEEFNLHLKAVDSLSMKIPSEEVMPDGRVRLIPIRSVLQNVTGYLSIDRATNKSSYQKSSEYPVFKSDKQSYVYYDYPYIFNSVYNRNSFYFQVDPFTIDSLDNFKPEGLTFDGNLVSAGIFPDITEQLSIQQDYSLGFKRVLGDEGLPAYAGKGTYYEKLNLSNNGLRGGGRINYLNSNSESKDIVFFPDSANADIDDFAMVRKVIAGTEYPSGKATDVYMNWRPKQDKMFLYKKANNFSMYDGRVDHDGDLVLARSGLTGSGTISFEQAQILSQLFEFKGITLKADTSDFRLKSSDSGILALSTTNMKSFIDFDKRFGEFASNGTGSYVTFPLNQYICYIEKFKWLMDDKNVEFGMTVAAKDKTEMNIAGSEFVSINPSQDSLRWFSPDASYNLTDYLIKAKDVKEINVADASIIPGDGKVVIEKSTYIRTLVDAKVVANTSTRYHTMMNSTINITSRKNYSGAGDYEYVDQLKVKHLLRLTQIGVDTSYQTFANGDIPDSLNFMLSPNIQYKGRLSIQASRQSPFFRGFARANHNCTALRQNWFGFAAEIDPKGVNVPVRSPLNENGEKLYSSIFFGKDSANVYATFMSAKRSASDQEIVSAEGLLSYDNSSKEFRLMPPPEETGKKEKESKDAPEKPFNTGNAFALDDVNCSFRGEGNINLGANFGQLKTKTIGVAKFDPVQDTLYFDVMADLDFFFNQDALKLIADLMLTFPTLPPTNDNRPEYQNGLRVLLGRESADKYISDISLYGAPKKLPEEMQHSIFLTDLKLYWQKESLSYKSVGPIGIGYMGKQQVNRMVKGYFEIARKRSGDQFNLYFELDGNTWVYFNYQRGVLQAIASDPKFNETIDAMKPDKRVADEKGGLAPYQFLLSTDRKKNEFLKRAENRE